MALEPKQVGKAARRLWKFLRRRSSAPITPEEIHRLRTTIRRLEAAVNAVMPRPSRRERKLMREVSRIRKRAGKIRDMDVLTADAISMRRAKNEQDHLVELIHRLGTKRHKQAKRLDSLIQKKGRTVSKGVKRLSSHLRRRMSPLEPSKDPSKTEPAIAGVIHLLRDLKRPPRLSAHNLHPYRLKVKELRDIIRLAQGPVQAGVIAALGKVKDEIGDWHDWEELLSIANRVLDNQSSSLISRIRRIAARKYSRALSSALGLRQKYFSARGGLSITALRTTSTLAA